MFDGAIPKWNWISGVKIEKSDLVKEALYRAYEKLWINLNHLNPTDKTVDALMKLELPAGVDVQIKLN